MGTRLADTVLDSIVYGQVWSDTAYSAIGQNPNAHVGGGVGLEPAQIVYVAMPVNALRTDYGIFATQPEADEWNIANGLPELVGPVLFENYRGWDIFYDDRFKNYFIIGVQPKFSSIELARAWVDNYIEEMQPKEPVLVETYREYGIWTRWISPTLSDYTTPSPVDAASSTIAGVRAAIDRYIKSITPEPEPQLAEVYREYEIWTRPEYNDYTVPPPINAAGNLAGVKAAIDRYLAAHPELVWSAETLQLFRGSGLTSAEIALIPPETSDLLEVELAVPKLAVLPSADEVRKQINDEMIAQGVEGEVVGIVVKLIKSDFFAFYEYQKAWVFVRSPLVVAGAISISLIIKAVFFAAILGTIIFWKWSDLKIAELRHQEITDINDVINNVLANPSLTDEQKQAIIDKLLETYQKATEEGGSWVDKLIELAPIGLLGVGLLVLLSFMPKRKG